MSKHPKILLALAIAAIGLTCKKDSASPTLANSNDCKITSIKHFSNDKFSFAHVLTYDEDKRLIKGSKKSADFNLTYRSDKIILTDSDGAQIELTLENGKVARADHSEEHYETYHYNTEGYLTQIKHFYSDTEFDVTDITYSGGNISKVAKLAFDEARTVITYEYSTELASSTLFIADPLYSDLINHFLPGIPFGKQSKNLKVKSIETFIENDPINISQSEEVAHFTYAKDVAGRYSKVVTKFEGTFSSGDRKFTYSGTKKNEISYACE